MNDEPTGKALPNEESGTDWQRLRHMSDADICVAISDDPDIIPTDADFWQNATVVLPEHKPVIISKKNITQIRMSTSDFH